MDSTKSSDAGDRCGEPTILVVEGIGQLSQTFIRNDQARISRTQECEILDILDYKLDFFKPSFSNFILFVNAVVFFFRHISALTPLLVGRRYRAVVHSILIFSAIQRASGDFYESAHLRAHFLGKCAIICYLFHLHVRTSYSVVCHGSDLYSSPPSFDRILKGAVNIECVTFFGKGFVYGRLGSCALGKTIVNRNAISGDHSPVITDPVTRQGIVATSVCRLVPQKDMEFCLLVIAELKNRMGGPILLHIIGEGSQMEHLMKLTDQLGIKQNVKFHGSLENSLARNKIADSDFFILPCSESDLDNADGLPVVFQEALSLGVPVFCRKSFGVSEFCISGLNGYAFEIESSPEQWAQTIAEALPDLDGSMIKKISRYQFS